MLHPSIRRVRRFAPGVAVTLMLVACGSTDAVTVDDVWSRASAPGQTQGVVYFDLTTAEDDTLTGASVDATVAAAAELHEVVPDDGSMDDSSMDDMAMDDESMDDESMDDMSTDEGSHDMESSDEASAMMRMQELSGGLALEANETVVFEPGGYHVMLPDLVGPLAIGDEFDLTLEFAAADDVTITVKVSETAP